LCKPTTVNARSTKTTGKATATMRLCKLVQLVKIHSKATKEKLPDLEVGNNANIEESLLPVRNGFCHYKRKLM
jgi:hypothetical protein